MADLVSVSFAPAEVRPGQGFSVDKYRMSMDQLGADLPAIAGGVNTLTTALDREIATRQTDSKNTRGTLDARINEHKQGVLDAAYQGVYPSVVVDFHRLKGPFHEMYWENSSASFFTTANRCRVDTKYGQLMLPYNTVVNRIFSVDTRSGKVVAPNSLTTEVVGTDNDGTVVATGDIRDAFNGKYSDYWIRKVRFPINSDVTEVSAAIEIALPDDYSTDVNMISLDPYPLGNLDLTDIRYTTDGSTPTASDTQPSSFTAENDISFKRWHFTSAAITNCKFWLRQRNWIEEDGWKVFYIGLREVDFQLIGVDQSADEKGIVVELTAPSNDSVTAAWKSIQRWFSEPMPGTAAGSIRVRAYTDATLSTNIWDSNTNLPQDISGITVTGNQTKLYLKITMTASSNAVSPVVEWFNLGYDLKKSDGTSFPSTSVTDTQNVKTITSADSPYTVLPSDDIVLLNTAGGNITLTLPALGTLVAGKEFTFKKIAAANTVTINPPGGVTIDGAASYTLTNNYRTVGMTHDTSNYFITRGGNTTYKQYSSIGAGSLSGSTTSGAAGPTQVEYTTNDINILVMDFDNSSQEYAEFLLNMPDTWDAGTVRAKFKWTADSSSGNVTWGIQGICLVDDAAIDQAWGTAKEVTDTLLATGDTHESDYTDSVTIGGTPTAGSPVVFRVYRTAAGLAADARLIGIVLESTATIAEV